MSGIVATADVCDANAELLGSGELRVLPAVFKSYGRRRAFSGRVVTVKVFDDNVLVRAALEGPGEGRVLVVDGAGSMRCALLGGNLAVLAARSGWSGIVVYGCVRDVDEIDACDIGVRALAPHPAKSAKRGVGENHVAVHIAGTLVRDGDWLCADADGVLVSPSQLNP